MKSIVKNIIRIIIYIVIIIITINYLFNIYRPYDNVTAYKPIEYSKQKKNSISVLFVGSSEVHNGISPMQLYRDYGFTSYDMSYSFATLKSNYYQILNSLHNQKPQLIVLDLSQYFIENSNEEQQHISIDYIPINDAKIKFVNDKNNKFSKFQKLSFLSPFFSYHDNWKNKKINQYIYLKNINNTYKASMRKGFTFIWVYNKIEKFKNKNYMNDSLKEINVKNSSYDYLLKIKEVCDKNNIILQLICMPSSSSWNNSKSMAIEKLSKELGLNFIDLNKLYDDTKIDLDYDFRDGETHLNIMGARKITDYLGNFLTSNYSMKDCRKDNYYSNWNKDLEDYEKLENKAMNLYNIELKTIKR